MVDSDAHWTRHRRARRAALAVAGALLLSLLLPATPPLAAGPRKQQAQCRKIKQAIQAGYTLAQIMEDLQVDEQHVVKCVQTKAKRRKDKKGKAAKLKPAARA
jgi:hypothetical protein